MKLSNMFYLSNNIKIISLLLLIANSFICLSTVFSAAKKQKIPLALEKQSISKQIDFILGKLKSTKLNEIPVELKKKVEKEFESHEIIEAALAQDPILQEFGKLEEKLETYLNHFGDSDSNTYTDNKIQNKKSNNSDNSINQKKKEENLESGNDKVSNKKKIQNNDKNIEKSDSVELEKMKSLNSRIKKISDKLIASASADENEAKANKPLKSKGAAGNHKKAKGELEKLNKLHNNKKAENKSKIKSIQSKNANKVKSNKDSEEEEEIDFNKTFEKLAQQNIEKLNKTVTADSEAEEQSEAKAFSHAFDSDLVDADADQQDQNKKASAEDLKNKKQAAAAKKIKSVKKKKKQKK